MSPRIPNDPGPPICGTRSTSSISTKTTLG
jgi:hypothetical protein